MTGGADTSRGSIRPREAAGAQRGGEPPSIRGLARESARGSRDRRISNPRPFVTSPGAQRLGLQETAWGLRLPPPPETHRDRWGRGFWGSKESCGKGSPSRGDKLPSQKSPNQTRRRAAWLIMGPRLSLGEAAQEGCRVGRGVGVCRVAPQGPSELILKHHNPPPRVGESGRPPTTQLRDAPPPPPPRVGGRGGTQNDGVKKRKQ